MTPQEYVQLTGRSACTKKEEYLRSIELFENIFKEKGTYYALAFLYDIQYCNADLKNMFELIKPNKK